MSGDKFAEIDQIYQDAKVHYRSCKAVIKEDARGYDILYAPPKISPNLLIIGYQPAGDNVIDPASFLEEPTTWPTDNAYLRTAPNDFRLARKMRAGFGDEFIEHCGVMNAIFLTCKSVKKYDRLRLHPEVQEFESFSLRSTRSIIRLMMPKAILLLRVEGIPQLLGIQLIERLTRPSSWVLGSGSFEGIPAYAIAHPTGSRLSDDCMKAAGNLIKHEIGYLPAASS